MRSGYTVAIAAVMASQAYQMPDVLSMPSHPMTVRAGKSGVAKAKRAARKRKNQRSAKR